jgi:cytochrome P450
MDAAASAALGLTDYVAARLRAAMVSDDRPDDALLAVLARAIDDSTITFDEALGMLLQLLNAGTETTTGLIARAIHTLAVEPGTQDPLRQQPARIPEFLEEVLRTRGPFQFHYRCTPTDTVLGTASIPAGSRVLLMWAAASRPHPVGTEPETDIDHEGTRVHYAFGRGIHFCIGAHLARLEARLAIEQLLAATTHIELDPDRPPGERRTIFLRRHTTLPIRLR